MKEQDKKSGHGKLRQGEQEEYERDKETSDERRIFHVNEMKEKG